MATLQLEHVYKNYRDVKAVIDANWICDDGEIVSILGPSGCGKSSSLRMIAGLEKISDGSIRIGERIVNDLTPAERNIAMAFENYALYSHMTVEKNITYPLRIRKRPAQEIRKRADYILNLLELKDIADYKVTGLSGGQKQRVSLAGLSYGNRMSSSSMNPYLTWTQNCVQECGVISKISSREPVTQRCM